MEIARTEHLFYLYALDGVGLAIAEDKDLIVAHELARSKGGLQHIG